MIEISSLRADETAEAKRVIYRTAHSTFHEQNSLAEALDHYAATWPLRDVDDFQRGYVENGGVFLVLREGDQIIGTGALRRYDGHTGEIKRVWLLPDYHGQGLGYRLMQALLGVARDYGYTKVRLQTSPSFQPRAFLFYQQMGFIEIPAYGDDPDDVGMELTLT